MLSSFGVLRVQEMDGPAIRTIIQTKDIAAQRENF
jgi:hypothetical protein